jgi:conjugative relaxase-like TrwC/TraI family protein
MFDVLGVGDPSSIDIGSLARALQGLNVSSGDRVRKEGMIERPAVDSRGRPLYDNGGRRLKVKVKGTKCADLTFSAPKSVSVIWSQADAELQAKVEQAMLAAAGVMLGHLTHTKPIVSQRRVLSPACGFAAALSLHVSARAAAAQVTPAPQLHVHSVLLAVERTDGGPAAPELSGFFKGGAPLEGGALGRLALAEALADLGFRIDAETGRNGRFFEVSGVPDELVAAFSQRHRDVLEEIVALEASRGHTLTSTERTIAALSTRAPKAQQSAPAAASVEWRRVARQHGFDARAVEALRRPRQRTGRPPAMRDTVLASAQSKLVADAGYLGGLQTAVFEAAAGRLGVRDAIALADELTSET